MSKEPFGPRYIRIWHVALVVALFAIALGVMVWLRDGARRQMYALDELERSVVKELEEGGGGCFVEPLPANKRAAETIKETEPTH